MLSSETRTWQENFAQRLKISKHISNQNRNHQARRFWNLKSLKFNKIKSPVHPGNSLLLLPRDFEVRQIQFQIRHMVTGLHPLWNVCLATSIHRWHHDASFQENYDWEIWWHPELIQLRSFKHSFKNMDLNYKNKYFITSHIPSISFPSLYIFRDTHKLFPIFT